MKKLASLISAVSISMGMMVITPSWAAPLFIPLTVEKQSHNAAINVQYRERRNHYRASRNHYRPRHYDRRYDRRHYNRRHSGNAAAGIIGGLAAGAIISGMVNQNYRAPAGNSHINWCLNKYRSYDPSSNTYQPFNGPRRYCNSPYR